MKLLRLALILLAVAATAGNYNSASVTCPGSGNRQISSTSLRATWAIIMAPSANTGKVYFGGSTVAVSTTAGFYLSAGDSYNFPPHGGAAVYDLSQVYFACAQSGDALVYNYLQ